MTPRRRSNFLALAAMGGSAFLLGFSAGRCFDGGAGLAARGRTAAAMIVIAAERGELSRRRSLLATEVERLRRDPPDADLIDELAADLLGFGRPGEVVVPAPRPGTRPLAAPQVLSAHVR